MIGSMDQSAISCEHKPSLAATPSHQPWSSVWFHEQDVGRATCKPAIQLTFGNDGFYKEPQFQDGTASEASSCDLTWDMHIFYLAWPAIPVSCHWQLSSLPGHHEMRMGANVRCWCWGKGRTRGWEWEWGWGVDIDVEVVIIARFVVRQGWGGYKLSEVVIVAWSLWDEGEVSASCLIVIIITRSLWNESKGEGEGDVSTSISRARHWVKGRTRGWGKEWGQGVHIDIEVVVALDCHEMMMRWVWCVNVDIEGKGGQWKGEESEDEVSMLNCCHGQVVVWLASVIENGYAMSLWCCHCQCVGHLRGSRRAWWLMADNWWYVLVIGCAQSCTGSGWVCEIVSTTID